jgi:hypothetical protein
MQDILGFTNELSQVLQRKDQDIENAMMLVKVTKLQLQKMRDEGWDFILQKTSLFCNKHDIIVPNMNEIVVLRRPRRRVEEITNEHRYFFSSFYIV